MVTRDEIKKKQEEKNNQLNWNNTIDAAKTLQESLEWESNPYLFSWEQVKNMLKWDNRFNYDFTQLPWKIWSTITDKDEEKWILDYSEYKHYKKALDNADENTDLDAVYKQMAYEWVIDYDKFTKWNSENKEEKPVMSKYEQAVSDIKTDFDNKLSNALSPYMSWVEWSYQLNAVTKAREEMYDQFEMFINSYAWTYKDTRDKKMLEDFNDILDEYENSIIQFTTQWASNLVNKDKKWLAAYYDTLNDEWMRNYANQISKIQAQAENKMTRAALIDSFEWAWEALKNFNVAWALWEIIRGWLNGINWIFDKAWNVIEEWKQIAFGWYDVVEELANLNVYDNDAGVLERSFWTMASWAWEVLDWIPTWWPAVLDIIFGSKTWWTKATKIWEVAKTTKYANKIDEVISTIFKNRRNINLISKADDAGILLKAEEWNTALARFTKNLMDDIILFDVSAQQFEWRPISDNDALTNMLFNIPIDTLVAKLSRWARYFAPDISKDILTSDIISDDMLNILTKWKNRNKWAWKSIELMAENVYMLASLEQKAPKKWLKMWTKEEISNLEWWKELVDYINKVQQEASGIWNRLTTFQDVTNRDILLSAQSKIGNLKNKSSLQILNEGIDKLATDNNVIDILRNQVRVKSLYAYIKSLISEWRISNETLQLALNNAKIDWEWFKQLLEVLLLDWEESKFREALAVMQNAWSNTISQNTIYKNFNNILWQIYKQDNNVIQAGDILGWYVKTQNWYYYDIFNPWQNTYTEEEFFNKILPGLDKANDSINKDALTNAIDKELLWDWKDEKDVSSIFEWTPVKKLLDSFKNDQREKYSAEWVVDKVRRDNPKIVAINELFNKLWLKLKTEGWVPTIYSNRKTLEKVRKWLWKLNQFQNLTDMDTNAWATYKLLFADDYANQFDNIIRAIEADRWDEAEKLTRDFIESAARNRTSPHENLYKKLSESAIKLNKAIENKEVELKEAFKKEEFSTKLSEDILNSLDGKWTASQVEATAAEIDIINKTVEATDMDWLEDELMKFFQIEVDANTLNAEDKTIKWLWDKELTWRKVMMGKIPADTARNIIKKARSVVENMSFESSEDKLKAFSVIWKWLATLSTCPYTATILSKQNDTFVNVLLSRILVNDEKATYVYMNYMQNKIDKGIKLLSVNLDKSWDIFQYNKWVMEMRDWLTQMQNRIEAIKNYYESSKAWIDMTWVKEQVIANITKLNNNFFNDADFDAGKKAISIMNKWFMNKFANKWEIVISSLTDKDITSIASYLAQKEIIDSKFYSRSLYKNLRKSFEKWLARAKELTPNATFKVEDWAFKNVFENNTSVFWVFNIARILWNINSEDLWATAIIHEIMHQDNIAGLWNYSKLHWYVGDVAQRGRLLAEDKYLTKNMWWTFLSYVQWLKEKLKQTVIETSKNWQFKNHNSFLYSYSNEYSRKEILDWIQERFGKENLINSLVEKRKNFKLWEHSSNLELWNIIDDEYVTVLEEIITEYRTMAALWDAWYKYANAPYVLEALNTLEKAADVIDRFRVLCIEDTRLTNRSEDWVRQILSATFNDVDLRVSETFENTLVNTLNKWIKDDAKDWLTEWSARNYIKKVQNVFKVKFMPLEMNKWDVKNWMTNALDMYKTDNIAEWLKLSDTNFKEIKKFVEWLDDQEAIQFLDTLDCIDMSPREYNKDIVNKLMERPLEEVSNRFDLRSNYEWANRSNSFSEVIDNTILRTDTEKEMFVKKVFTEDDYWAEHSKIMAIKSIEDEKRLAMLKNLERQREDMKSTLHISDWLLKNKTKENVWIKATINWMWQSLGWLDGWYIDILNNYFKNARESIDSKKLLVWNKTLEAFENSKTNQDLTTFVTNKIVANLLDKKWIYNQDTIDAMNNVMFIDNINKAISDLSNRKWWWWNHNPVALQWLIDLLSEEYWLTDGIDIMSKLTSWDIDIFNTNVQKYLSSFINSYSNEEIGNSVVDAFSKQIANEFVRLVNKAEWVANKRTYYLAFDTLLYWDAMWHSPLNERTQKYLKKLLAPYGDFKEMVDGREQFMEKEDITAKLSSWINIKIKDRLEADEIIDEILPIIRNDKSKYKKNSNQYRGLTELEDALLKEKNRTKEVAFGKWVAWKPTNTKFTKEQTQSLRDYNRDAKPYVSKIEVLRPEIDKLQAELDDIRQRGLDRWLIEQRTSIRKKLNTAEWLEAQKLRREYIQLQDVTYNDPRVSFTEVERNRIKELYNSIQEKTFELDKVETELDDISRNYQWVLEYNDLTWKEIDAGFYWNDWERVEWDPIDIVSEDWMLNALVENNIGPKFIEKVIDKYKMKYSPIYNIVEDGISNEAKALEINYAVFYNQIKWNEWIGKEIDDTITSLLERVKELWPDNVNDVLLDEWKKRRYIQNIKDWLYVWWTTVDSANVRGIDNILWARIGWEKIDKCVAIFSDWKTLTFSKEWDRLNKKFSWWINSFKLANSIINSTVKWNWVIVRFVRDDWKILEQKQISKNKVRSSFVWQEVSKDLWIYDKIQRNISEMNANEFNNLMWLKSDNWTNKNSVSNYINAIKQVWVKKISLWWTAVEEVLYQDVFVTAREKIKEEITYINMLLDDDKAVTKMPKEEMKSKLALLNRDLNTINNIMKEIRNDLPDSSWVKEEYETFKSKAKTFTIEDVDKYFDKNWNLWEWKPGNLDRTYVKYKKVMLDEDWNIVPFADGNEEIEFVERKYKDGDVEITRENTIFYYRQWADGNPWELIKTEPLTNKRTVIWRRPKYDVEAEDMYEKYVKQEGLYTKKIYPLDIGNSYIIQDLKQRWEIQWLWYEYEYTQPQLDMLSWELRLVMKNDLTWEEIEWILRDVPVVNQKYWTTYRMKEFTPVDANIKFWNLQINNALEKWKLTNTDNKKTIQYINTYKAPAENVDKTKAVAKRIEEDISLYSKKLLEAENENKKLNKEFKKLKENLQKKLWDWYKKDKEFIKKAEELNKSYDTLSELKEKMWRLWIQLDRRKIQINEKDIEEVPENINSLYFNYSKWERKQYPGISSYYINPNTNRLIKSWEEWTEDMFNYSSVRNPYWWSTLSDIEDVLKAAEKTREATLLDTDMVFMYWRENKWIGNRWLEWIQLHKDAKTNKLRAVKAVEWWIITEWAAKKVIDAAQDIDNMIKECTKIDDKANTYAQNMFDDKESLNRLFALTNYDILGNSEYLQHIRWTRDAFISKNKKELEDIVSRWDTIVGWMWEEEKKQAIDAIKDKINKSIQNAKWDRLIEKPMWDAQNNLEELVNQFSNVFTREGSKWYNDWILRMIKDTNSMEDILYKLYFSDAISMIWLNSDVHNINEARDTIYARVKNMVKTEKEARQIASDFVWDPLWWGNTYKLMSNIRSAARFTKYSILSPISWTIMFMNSALLSEPLLAGKKKIVWQYLNNVNFNKILENEDILSFMSKDWSIIENGNTDMSLKWIWVDNQLKKFANFISNPNSKTKLWKQWNSIVNTVMLWWWHSLYDLFRQWEVKKVAFAQALNEMWIPETAMWDLLAKINDWRIYTDPALSRTRAQVMAKTEEFYARFFTNAWTQALSRHRFSRLYGFNFLQWYVINRTDEMLQGLRQFQTFVNNAGIGNLTRDDVTRHLATDNQELLSFMNNVLASIKMGYYYEKASSNDSKRDNNLIWYFVASNDYLSSLDATWFMRLLMSPFDSIKAYKQYSERAWTDVTIWGWVKVATAQLFSDICSQFFREGKFLNAIRDTLVAYWKTWDLDFAATVAWVEWWKMANSLWRFWLVEWQEKYWLEDFSQNSDIIWQMLLATDKVTKWWKEQQNMYDITNVDNIINNDKGYTTVNILSKLPLIWEFIKSGTNKWWFAFSEAKYQELMHIVETDKWVQQLYKGKLDTEVYSDQAINRLRSDFTSFNYPYKTLKSVWKHAVWSYVEWKDTTLNSMREDVFVQNICEKNNMTIEEFHDMIASDSAKTTGRLKVIAASEAAEPGAWKIVLSYIMANDLYKLEQMYTNKEYPSTADIPEDIMYELKRAVLEKDGELMFTADKASWYKTIMEYVSETNPWVFWDLYKDSKLTNYVNSIWFMDMLMYDAAQKWDVNAAYIKNVFWVISKYMQNDEARIKATEHLFNTIQELDAPQSVKNMAMKWTLAGNIDFYNKLKNSPILSSIYWDKLREFEELIWWTLETEVPDDNMYNYSSKKYTPYSSQYWDSNKKVNDDLTKKANQYFPKSSWNGTSPWNYTPKGYTTNSIKPTDALDWYWKYYEGLIKDYSDKLVKSGYKTYPADKTEQLTFNTWSNNRWSIKWKQLSFQKHKSKEYRTNVISSLPGSHG